MLAHWFLRRRVVYPAVAAFCFGSLAPDFAQAQQRDELPLRPRLQLAQATTPPAYSEAKQELDRLFAAAEETRRTIDRTNFDPAARAAQIGPDIGKLYAFVRDWIAYHPYSGTLRFASGTLMSRAGNSCDKSILLAAMLRQHGHQVRFARAQLSESTARALVALSDRPASADSRSSLGFEMRAAFGVFMKRAGFSDSDIANAAREDEESFAQFLKAWMVGVDYSAEALEAALARAGIDFTGKTSARAANLVEAARDHCWVQFESGGQWTDLDASVFRMKLGQRLAEPVTISEAPPTDLAFRLRFVVTVERFEGGQLERSDILDNTVPLLDAVNRIALNFVPENAARSGLIGQAHIAELSRYGVAWPLLTVNDKAVAGDPFDFAGRKLARDPRERALGAFGSALGGSRPSELRRVILTISVAGPGNFARTHEREMIRRAAGPRDKAEANLRLQLLGTLDLAISASRIDESFLTDAALGQIAATRSPWEHLLKVDHGIAKAGEFDVKTMTTQRSGQALRYLFLRSNFLEARIAADAPGLIAFAGEPQIVAYGGRILPSIDDRPSLAEGFDVFANVLRVYDDPLAKPGVSTGASLFQFQQGVVDTVLEYVLMGDGDAINAFSVTAAALRRDGSAGLVSIRPGDQAAVDRLAVDPTIRASIRQDLQQGYVVIAPAAPVDLSQRKNFAWWRVNPDTGESLGMGPGGRGQGFAEKVLIEASLFVGHFLECFVIEVAVMAWKDDYNDARERVVVCLAFSAVMMFAGNLIWQALSRVLDRLKAVASKGFGRAAKWATSKFRKPVYTPGTPPVPNPGKSVGKGVGDAVKGAGPARPGPVVDPKAPTLSEPPGSMTPTRPVGPTGTQIFPPIQ